MKRFVTTSAIAATVALAGQVGVSPVIAQEAEFYTVSGQVFVDSNQNGKKDDGESPASGVAVTLSDSTGVPWRGYDPAITDSNGRYQIENVPEGDFTLKFESPKLNGVKYTTPGVEAGSTEAFHLDADKLVDVGYISTAYIGGTVWPDLNSDGNPDIEFPQEVADEISKVTVTSANSQTDIVSEPVAVDRNGNYVFTQLEPGEYVVQFNLPETLEFADGTPRDHRFLVEVPEGASESTPIIQNALVKMASEEQTEEADSPSESAAPEDAESTTEPSNRSENSSKLAESTRTPAGSSSAQKNTSALSEATKSTTSKAAAANQSSSKRGSSLARTGASVLGVVVIALALVGLGFVLVGRRRKDEGLEQ